MLTRQQVKMGTYASLSLLPKDIGHAQRAFEILDDVEDALSSYKDTTPISRLNRLGYASLNPYAYEALKLCKEFYKETEGYFDISVGKITHGMYAFGKREFVPHPKLLEKALFSMDALFINEEEASLSANNKIDLGGMGKGYGVDVVAAYFKEQNITQAVIALSGDIRCLHSCSLAVASPYETPEYLATFVTTDKETGVSTSGTYNRFVATQMNNHLITPKTKKPQQNFASVTLLGFLSNAELDAYATAVSVMPKEKAYRFLHSMGLGYIILEKNERELVVSENIALFVKELKLLLPRKDRVNQKQ